MISSKQASVKLIIFFSIILAACNNRQDVHQGDYFNAHVEVTGEEGNPRAVVLVHLSKEQELGERENDTLGWKVSLDQVRVAPLPAPDGAMLYESQQDAAAFTGDHELEVRGPGKASLNARLSFQPLVLQQELPEQVNASGFDIQLQPGIDSLGLRLVLTDTAFASNDFHGAVTVDDGVIHVTEEMLKNLSPGPLNLELYRLHRKRLESVGHVNGMLEERYSLRRNTTLVK